MKRFQLLLILAVALAWAPVFAADAPASAPAPSGVMLDVSEMDTNKDGKVDNAELQAYLAKNVGAADAVAGAMDVVKGITTAKTKWSTEKLIAVATALAAIFKLLLSLVKMLGNTKLPWLATPAGKNTIKYSTLALGVLAALFANLAGGMSIPDALLFLGSGPLAVAVHEYLSPAKSDPPPASA